MPTQRILSIYIVCAMSLFSFRLSPAPIMGSVKHAFESGLWTEDIDGSIQYAKQVRRPVLVLFTGSDWCYWCKKLDEDILSQSAFRERMRGRFILLYVDFPRHSALPKDVSAKRNSLRQRFNINAYPTMVVLKDGDEFAGQVRGFPRGATAEKYISEIERIASTSQ